MNNSKPAYKAPVLYGVKESEVTAMSSNRYMMGECCFCSGRGSSRT